jgi:predicted nuclease with TOPRIM domain
MTEHKCNWQLGEDGSAICLDCTTVIGADGLIESLQEEIAALRAERATLSNGLMIQTDQVEHSEKVIEELEKVAEHAAALFYNHELTETWDALEEALREAGYGGGE